MHLKAFTRRLLNMMVSVPPRTVTRHLLKSLWYQPRLQDALAYHVQPYRFDSAIPTTADVNVAALSQRRMLPGIRLDPQIYLPLVDELAHFSPELSDIPN